MRQTAIGILGLAAVAAAGCGVEPSVPDDGGVVLRWHQSHTGAPPWPHILTCYGGCAAPHYDPSACHGSTACCSSCIDGTWWYATEQSNFGCGAKLELRRDDKCVIVEVADNGPADWVEADAASTCGGTGYIIDTSPLVNDYFGGGCGWSECFWIDVRPVDDTLPAGICPSCPCDGTAPYPVFDLRAEIDDVAGQERDFCRLYGSEGTFDLRVGQTTLQRFYVANTGDGVAQNLVLGLQVEEPYLVLRRWDVYDDGGSCGAEWCLNDSNSHPSNPPHDDPGAALLLYLYSLSPGETKMVELRLDAAAYSIGAADHPDVRAWVKHADDYYEKSDFSSTDFTNVGGYQTFNGGDLRIYTETDVLATETCNGVDDDCNGAVDEGCGTADGGGGQWDAGSGDGPGGSDADGREDGAGAPARPDVELVGGCGCTAARSGARGGGAFLVLLAARRRRTRVSGPGSRRR